MVHDVLLATAITVTQTSILHLKWEYCLFVLANGKWVCMGYWEPEIKGLDGDQFPD
jgi:hypothetical protein